MPDLRGWVTENRRDVTLWGQYTRRVVGLLLLAAVLFFVWLARPIIPTLLIAAVIAFLIEPMVSGLQRLLHVPRILGALVVLVLVVLVIVLLVVVFAPLLANQFSQVNVNLADALQGVLGWLRTTSEGLREISVLGFQADLNPYVDDFQQYLDPASFPQLLPSGESLFGSLPSLLATGVGTLAGFATTVGRFLLTLLFTLLYIVYLVHDAPRMAAGARSLIPDEQHREVAELRERLAKVWKSYFRGQLLLVTMFGVLVGLTMWALGLRAALIIGVLSAVMDLIPTLGALIAGGLTVVVALVQGSSWMGVNNFLFALIVLGAYLVLQQVEASVLQPRIMGSRVDLPGFVVIVGVTAGAAIAGILGAYLAVPVIATIREVFLFFFVRVVDMPPAATGVVVEAPPQSLVRRRRPPQRRRPPATGPRAPRPRPRGPRSR